uniref:Ig-like domain-containing protein n=1 Tax=Mastacembelus armatus TaxID=205130 RepID=A0A3Q3L9V8_9TELE
CCWLISFRLTDMKIAHFAAMGSMNSIKPKRTEEAVAEGRNINLTCTYEGAINNIQWYRQYQRSRPEFLLYITEGKLIHPVRSDFSAHINSKEKRVDLEIKSAAVSDSAVYYCALQPHSDRKHQNSVQKPLEQRQHNTPQHPPEGDTHC